MATPRRAPTLPPQLTFGGRVPAVVGLMIVITAALSLSVVFGDRHAGSIFDLVVLRPEAVWRGQIWRLVTFAFVEPGPIGLIFQCLFLYWFGRDLVQVWGSRRFAMMYVGIALVSSIGTSLIAKFLDSKVLDHVYAGGWPLTAAVTVAWGLYFPDRVIRIHFILPIRGYVLAWVTVGLTIVFAIYSGWEGLLPELCAEGAMLVFLFRGKILRRWLDARRRWTIRSKERELDAIQKDRAKKRAKSVDYLRVVESHDDDTPDLPPDVNKKLDDLLRGGPTREKKRDPKDLN